MELGRPVLVGGVRVTFLDANHCPGAAMALLESPGRPPILHTGDCRHGTTTAYLPAQSRLQTLRVLHKSAAAHDRHGRTPSWCLCSIP